jgi:outer membrane protein assembly factor BamB
MHRQIADGILYIGSWDSYFYALDAVTGKERWRFKTGEDAEIHNQVGIQSSAAVADGMVFFGCRDSHLYALDAHTGEKKWAYSGNGSWIISSPAVKDGKVYFDTSDTSLVIEADAKSGAVLHSFNLNHWYLYSSPAIARGMMYLGSTQGKLVAVDLDRFAPAWTFETEGMKQHGATYTKSDGTPDMVAIFRSDFYDDMVGGVDRVMSMGSILGAPVVIGNEVYFGSADGSVYALM